MLTPIISFNNTFIQIQNIGIFKYIFKFYSNIFVLWFKMCHTQTSVYQMRTLFLL